MKVTIERLGHLGDGIAAGPVYVPRALPGEVVEGEVADGRMDAPAIVTPSPDRRRAPCPHYAACGGCALMHATDGFVEDWKADVVRAALAAQGLPAPIRAVHTSPERSRRRATLSGRRTKKGAIVGFHGRASGTLADLSDCHLLLPSLTALLPALRDLTIAGGSRKGEISLTVTATEAGADVAVSGGKPLEPALFTDLAAIAERADLARLTWEGEPVAVRRPATQRFGGALVEPPSGAFLQATREGEAALLAAARAALGGADRIADLFSGAGTFSLPLAAGSEVHAVESERTMLAALDRAARHAPGLHRITTEPRDLFRRPLLPDELDRYDAILLDPPRAGAEAQVSEIAASRTRAVAYISCNPVSFARDARILSDAGFTLDWIEVVDQFRWSTHVELAARLTRTGLTKA
ncbi:class I SAM-dependent RNA methyltransferase [Frigidibacter sp. RF13]|uniref:class I SAM-dependent RNA methyltransferase n=1 Tax=Frigidibacter sp. RF13 TaxID=2997340 RepID=UPI0022707C28|nr:class I SAM-dependent RNA methyltransferase [Frigidibacter sp. RF13]MCY1126737.1 class I SAM-dependent RNA methyltransferase [Frigidibacter sp. RF13]